MHAFANRSQNMQTCANRSKTANAANRSHETKKKIQFQRICCEDKAPILVHHMQTKSANFCEHASNKNLRQTCANTNVCKPLKQIEGPGDAQVQPRRAQGESRTTWADLSETTQARANRARPGGAGRSPEKPGGAKGRPGEAKSGQEKRRGGPGGPSGAMQSEECPGEPKINPRKPRSCPAAHRRSAGRVKAAKERKLALTVCNGIGALSQQKRTRVVANDSHALCQQSFCKKVG